jgi:hypothetical protein
MTHVVNFYLDEERKQEKDAIVALARRPISEETEGLLIGYVREALRECASYHSGHELLMIITQASIRRRVFVGSRYILCVADNSIYMHRLLVCSGRPARILQSKECKSKRGRGLLLTWQRPS